MWECVGYIPGTASTVAADAGSSAGDAGVVCVDCAGAAGPEVLPEPPGPAESELPDPELCGEFPPELCAGLTSEFCDELPP